MAVEGIRSGGGEAPTNPANAEPPPPKRVDRAGFLASLTPRERRALRRNPNATSKTDADDKPAWTSAMRKAWDNGLGNVEALEAVKRRSRPPAATDGGAARMGSSCSGCAPRSRRSRRRAVRRSRRRGVHARQPDPMRWFRSLSPGEQVAVGVAAGGAIGLLLRHLEA